MAGEVVFYGKPQVKVFASMPEALGTERILMVGDSLEHDIAGAKNIKVQVAKSCNVFANFLVYPMK